MKLIRCIPIAILIVVTCPAIAQSDLPPYHGEYDFLMASPGGLTYGLYGYVNPALIRYVERPDLLFAFSDSEGDLEDFDRWGLFGARHLFNLPIGFGAVHRSTDLGSVTDYRISIARGNRNLCYGIGFGWSGGDTDALGRTDVVTLGTLVRPNRYLSLGLSSVLATNGDHREGVVDLAIRPLADERITLFSDYALQDDERLEDGHWSAGLAVEALPGVRITGRYFDTEAFAFGLAVSFGRIGLGSQAFYDEEQNYGYNTYSVRLGATDRNIFRTYLARRKRYLKLDIHGPVRYQRYRLFDRSITLTGLLSAIDAAMTDDTIAGIALDISGMRINREMGWELREKLAEFKRAGKHTIVFADGLDIDGYHLASVADRIVMDPSVGMILEGYLLGRTYLKGTMEKVGLGFDEWRFFTYKSAYEGYSRKTMSDADREQRQRLVDEYYRLARSEICESRGIDTAEFDRLVNDEMLILPDDALRLGLVDSLGRKEDMRDVIKGLEGSPKATVNPGALARYLLPKDNRWGEAPRVAVIYAHGAVAMDYGMNARNLVKTIDGATNDPTIRAVVLRVETPGGSGLAADLITDAVKRCKKKKPVIVSQGFVAASAGYNISSFADTIVAAPNTITGSIGVIGGWLYNKGIKEMIGMSTDHVKAGEHADLNMGIRLPLIGLHVPDRNLDAEERAKVEGYIRHYYREFVESVAEGRGLGVEEIESIAQGRVWSGRDGKANGLVDLLGGLDRAISIAKEKAGIPEERMIRLVELPKPGLFNVAKLMPKPSIPLYSTERGDAFLDYLRLLAEHNGRPLQMMPVEDLPMIPGLEKQR
ncbi:MAG: signal peptide peptidase SppA [bacterium]|nr:MAG: signal peptide peptidase SppA [bacterium]